LNKDYGTRIINFEQTRGLIEADEIEFRTLEYASMRGRERPPGIDTIDD